MKDIVESRPVVKTAIDMIRSYEGMDLSDLCDATESTFLDDGLSFSIGMGRNQAMEREQLESYWKGVLLVPERTLIVGRIDGVIAASIQVSKPSPSNQTSAFCGNLETHFVAPWARGYGLAKELIRAAEQDAIRSGLTTLRLSVRANLTAAIRLYEASGYKRWGTLDCYERVNDQMLAGHFYYKDLTNNES